VLGSGCTQGGLERQEVANKVSRLNKNVVQTVYDVNYDVLVQQTVKTVVGCSVSPFGFPLARCYDQIMERPPF